MTVSSPTCSTRSPSSRATGRLIRSNRSSGPSPIVDTRRLLLPRKPRFSLNYEPGDTTRCTRARYRGKPADLRELERGARSSTIVSTHELDEPPRYSVNRPDHVDRGELERSDRRRERTGERRNEGIALHPPPYPSSA